MLASADVLVGGPCSYETRIGVARIAGRGYGVKQVRFYAGPNPFLSAGYNYSPGMKFAVREPVRGGMHTPYPARLRKEVKGACTPYWLTLLSTETRSGGVYLPFNANGNPLASAEPELRQIAYTVTTLLTYWPKLRIRLYGCVMHGTSSEYRHNLAEHYARAASLRLLALGVAERQLHIAATDESACSASVMLDDEGRDGVRIDFELQGEH